MVYNLSQHKNDYRKKQAFEEHTPQKPFLFEWKCFEKGLLLIDDIAYNISITT